MALHGRISVRFLFHLCFLMGFMNLLAPSTAAVSKHNFVVEETIVTRLCKTQTIITVNGMLPGPTLEVNNGDTLVVRVVNRARYNVTIHWHGIRQLRTGWADGTDMVTQCPIRPGGKYTYRFTIHGQEGTLWWHAHSSWLRATVYGALIIRPKHNGSYPFMKPDREVPVVIGEYWNADVVAVVNEAAITGAATNVSDAYTINGQPGDLYNCSSQGTTVVPVSPGETILFRFISAALNNEHFVGIAGHKMVVVGADASYTEPFTTSVLMLGPGQTTDVLVTADQAPARYYIAAGAYSSAEGVAFGNSTTTAIIQYTSCNCIPGPPPILPHLPVFNDNTIANDFAARIKSLSPVNLPSPVDEHLFFTVGLGFFDCAAGMKCGGPFGMRFGSSINNISFQLPSNHSILQAHQLNLPGVYTTDFPAKPPVLFDYTAKNVSRSLWHTTKGTKLYRLKYGSVVQLVLQATNIYVSENHPIHLHGNNFYVLAMGNGNFNAATDTAKFNLVDPPLRNTVGVPVKGWAVIRFKADNPGVWLLHCHLDIHITWGLSMAFLVEDGIGELQTLEPPPHDLPRC